MILVQAPWTTANRLSWIAPAFADRRLHRIGDRAYRYAVYSVTAGASVPDSTETYRSFKRALVHLIALTGDLRAAHIHVANLTPAEIQTALEVIGDASAAERDQLLGAVREIDPLLDPAVASALDEALADPTRDPAEAVAAHIRASRILGRANQ